MNNHQALIVTDGRNQKTKEPKTGSTKGAPGLHFECQFREHCKCSEGKERQSTQKKAKVGKVSRAHPDETIVFAFLSGPNWPRPRFEASRPKTTSETTMKAATAFWSRLAAAFGGKKEKEHE